MFKDLMEIPFEYGKMDCWILVQEVFNRYGVKVPEYSPARQAVMEVNYEFGCVTEAMEKELVTWTPLGSPEKPCLVVFPHHVGVYIGKGKFIHTTKQIGSAVIERLDNPLYGNRKFYRYDPACSD